MPNKEIEEKIINKINEAKVGKYRTWAKRNWFKVTTDGILASSLNYRMDPAQICIFFKLIALSIKHGPIPGLISDNDFRPLPHDYLAHQATCSIELFEETLRLAVEDNSIYENSHGIYMVNFDEYQFTEYDRQKPYREAKKARVTQEDMFKADAETISGQSIDTAILIAQGKMSGVPAKQVKFMQDALDMKKIPWKQEETE